MGGSANLYAVGPTLSKISKGTQNQGAILAQVPILKEIFLGLIQRYT
jgi:hypothetical protein